MSSWRLKQRLSYSFLFIGVVAALGLILFLFSRPAPSCFDNKQNQNEVGVDCGGLCEKVCPTEIKDLRVIWGPRIIKVAEGRYDAVALVQNPNPRHAVRSFDYVIEIFDSANLLISSRTGRAFLNPRESSVIFESRIEVGQRQPARAVLEFEGPPLWQKVERVLPEVRVIRKDFILKPAPRLEAEVENQSLVPIRDLAVAVVLFDEFQNVIGVSSTLVDELPAAGKKYIVFTWPVAFTSNVALITFYPHLNLARLPADR